MLKKKLSRALRRERARSGYTQSEIAEAVSISVRWYQMVENGKRLPGALVLLRLLLFLHVDIEELRGEVELNDSHIPPLL